jgi:hypothetical protein
MTAQFHEKLIFEGEETSMAFCPPIPLYHPRIVELSDDEIHDGIQAGTIFSLVFSTACWRHYIGTWKLEDGRFYLVDIEGRYKMTSPEPIFADWVTAVIRIPEGELLHYVHMGFGSVYEFETHLKIEKGVVVDERRIDNRKKDVNPGDLGWKNLPGHENEFDGDDL